MAHSTDETLLLQKYFAGKPVKRAFLFGSYARNTAIKGASDIDILLELILPDSYKLNCGKHSTHHR
jgi:predicted nucleotidyltransferase